MIIIKKKVANKSLLDLELKIRTLVRYFLKSRNLINKNLR